MNNDPQLTVFEPSKEPRTIKLHLTEDTETDSVTIYDENGCKVTDYRVLYDETQSPVDADKEKIIAYIKDWESQGNTVDEKQARKIDKRKRIQEKRKLKKERNKKRKMKSLMHRNYDSSPLANAKDVQEERALLRAMKTQKNRLKNVFNIKPNRIINCNTNVRPFENSTIEIGTRKKPIDVVVLDSDEEVDSDSDDIQINIDTPQLIQRRNTSNTNFTNDFSFGNRNSFVMPNSTPTTRRRRNKQVEIVQIVDSSDSDVECISCEEFIESLSDDDDADNGEGDNDRDNSSTARKTRSGNIIARNKSVQNTEELICVPEDEEANKELESLVDSFVSKFIQTALPPLPEISVDPEFDASQIMITEPISLRPQSSPPATTVSQEDLNSAPQLVITGSISLQPGDPRSSVLEKATPVVTISNPVSVQPIPSTRNESKPSRKQVTFNSTADEDAVNDDELVIIENDPSDNESLIQDLVDEPVRSDPAVEQEECQDSSEDSNDVEMSSKRDDNLHTLNVMEFDSIPSPDYTPFDSIPATASNIQAFAAFVKSREKKDSKEGNMSDVSDVSDDDLPIVLEESAKSTPKASTRSSSTPERRLSESNKQSGAPWRKRAQDTSNEVQVIQHSPANRKQSIESPKKCDRDELSNATPDVPQTATRDRTFPPWDKCHDDKSDEIQVLKQLPTNRKPWEKRTSDEFQDRQPAQQTSAAENHRSAPCCCTRSTSETRQYGKPYQVNSDNQEYRRNTFSNQRYPRKTYQRNALPPRNSAVEFLDKNSIRIGDPQNESDSESEKTCCEEKPAKLKSTIVTVEPPQRKVFPKTSYNDSRDRESNEPYRSWDNSQNRPFYQKHTSQWRYPPDKVWEVEAPWIYESDTNSEKQCEKSEPEKSQECDKSIVQDDQHVHNAQPSKRRNIYASELFEEEKFAPKRNRFHPEPYEEDKFDPNSQFSNRKIPWRSNQSNRDGSYRGQFRRNDQYDNRRTNYNENNFNRGRRYNNRYTHNQRYPQRQTFYNQRTSAEKSYSNYDKQSSYSSHNNYRNQSQTHTSSLQTRSSQVQNTAPEVLFTRRPEKFNYKANINDFDDLDDRHEQPSHYQVENYEFDVSQKLHSAFSDDNESSWENKVACDFVPVKSNTSVGSSPPWHSDSSNSNYHRPITAISRRGYIDHKINMRK